MGTTRLARYRHDDGGQGPDPWLVLLDVLEEDQR
jgi:hypothetical protein